MTTDADPEQNEDPEGPYEVSARWLFDLDMYNEWMNEEDYMVIDDEGTVRTCAMNGHASLGVMTSMFSIKNNEVNIKTCLFIKDIKVDNIMRYNGQNYI